MNTGKTRNTIRRGEKSSGIGKKHYSPEKGRTSDILVERYDEYRRLAQILSDYFGSVAKSEDQTAKTLTKSADEMNIPLRAGDQFITEEEQGGWQEALYKIRDRTREIAEFHSNFAINVETRVIDPLERIRNECKEFSARVADELGKLTDETDAERDKSANSIGQHSHGIGMVGMGNKSHLTAKDDPFITRTIVEKQLLKQLHQENKLTQSIISHQNSAEQFEYRINETLKDSCRAFAEEQEHLHEHIKEEWVKNAQLLENVDCDAEWAHFMKHVEDKFIDPNTPLRDPRFLNFPFNDHAATKPIKQGYLERKNRIRKSYKEDLFVLTQAGFLHQYEAANLSGADPRKLTPDLSLYLPECTLGPPAREGEKKHKFYIEGRRNIASGHDAQVKSLNLRKELQWTFKARSHSDMMAWWNCLDKVAKNSLHASPSPSTAHEHQGEVVEAVRNVGFPKEGQEATAVAPAAGEDWKVPGEGTSKEWRDAEEAASTTSGSSEEEEEEEEQDQEGYSTTASVAAAKQNVSEGLPGYVNVGQTDTPHNEKMMEKVIAADEKRAASSAHPMDSKIDKEKADPVHAAAMKAAKHLKA